MIDRILIKGARENNLKNIDVEIPRDKLVVLTGLSGSGKSSLAFETLYAEGQRRYVESLSSYARMFLGQMEKPDVDYIDGLSPAISIDQKTTSKNPRSTVGTVTEIYDYLRLLWARVGTPHCPVCGKEIKQQTIDQIIDQVLELPEATRIQVMAPVIRGKKGEHAKVFEDARRSGYVRCRVDGIAYDLSEEIKLEKNKKHNIEIVVDRLVIREDIARRLTDSVEIASNLSGGLVVVNVVGEDRDILFSQNYACEDCGVSIEELTPRMFSFNNPYGACPACTGLGSQLKVDPELIIPNKDLSILEGAISASGWSNIKSDGIARMYFDALAKKYRFKLDTPVKNLSPEVMDVILYGTRGEELTLHYDQPRGKGTLHQAFEGICNNLERRYKETQSDTMRRELEDCMSECPCPTCQGRRLRKESLAVTVGGLDIDAFCRKSVTQALDFVDHLELTEVQMRIAERILKEIKSRLGFLQSVGLQYLTLSRGAGSLSGGESQRIRLATQIGSSLMGGLYILDEPSIGLHQRDNDMLLDTMKHLRDLGNTLLVVEHDEDTMRAADYIIDVGPGAGVHGGEIVAAGTPEEVMNTPGSLTGDELAYFNEEFFNQEGTYSIRNQFLNSLYENSEDIDLFELLYCGTGIDAPMTDEELRQVGSFDTAGELICPVDKMSVEAINQVLLENTGLTLEETGRIGMDYFQYLPEYDAYYHSHGDTNYFSGVNITAGERVGDTIRLYYDDTFHVDGWKCVTLEEQADGSYWFVSNQPSERPAIPTVYPEGEPVLTIPLTDLTPYEPETMEVIRHRNDCAERGTGYIMHTEDGDELSVRTYLSTDGNLYAAVIYDEAAGRDGMRTWDVGCFFTFPEHNTLSYSDSGGYAVSMDSFSDLFGHDGLVIRYSGELDEHTGATFHDYYYFDTEGNPVLLARVYGTESAGLGLDGDGGQRTALRRRTVGVPAGWAAVRGGSDGPAGRKLAGDGLLGLQHHRRQPPAPHRQRHCPERER